MPDLEDSNHETQFEIPAEEFNAAVSSPDLRGRINLRIEQAMQQEIEDIAEDSRYPLCSVSEVVRFCCVDGLRRLRAWKPAPTLLGSIRAANALMMRDKLQCESLDLLDRLDERIRWYMERKHYDEIINLVANIRSYFDGLPEDFWSAHIQQEIDSRFVQWMDQIDKDRAG